MNEEYNIEFFKEVMEYCFRNKIIFYEENDSEIIYYRPMKETKFSKKEYKVSFNKVELKKCLDELNKNLFRDEEIYVDRYRYETLIEYNDEKIRSPYMGLYGMNRRIKGMERYKVSDDSIEICIDEISNTFNLYLLIKAYKKYKVESHFKRGLFLTINERELLKEYIDFNDQNEEICQDIDNEKINGFELIKDREIYSLKIVSRKVMTKEQFLDYQNAYLFNISLRYDINFIKPECYEYSYFRIRTAKRKTTKFDDLALDVPRKKYISDIVKYYTSAKINDNLPYKFLSYYHILEYFFEDVYYKDIVENVKDEISNPKFSLKDNNSIKEFVKNIEKKIANKKGDGIVFNEFYALKLTIKKYIPLENIEKIIKENNEGLLGYFKNEKCKFSDANKVNFTDLNTIASRIYKNRNALVHSKNSGNARYKPFKDELYLEKEIELIKVMAELLIINSAKII